MKKAIYEIAEPLRLLHTETGVWRVHVREATGTSIRDEDDNFVDYKRGDVIVFSTRKYLDAERVGFAGYVGHTVEVPESVVLEAADAIRAKKIPRVDA